MEYKPFWLVSTRISYKVFNNSVLFLEINNLLNNDYIDFGNIPQPGRWMRVGINLSL